MNKKISFLYLSRYGQFTKSESLKNLKVTAIKMNQLFP